VRLVHLGAGLAQHAGQEPDHRRIVVDDQHAHAVEARGAAGARLLRREGAGRHRAAFLGADPGGHRERALGAVAGVPHHALGLDGHQVADAGHRAPERGEHLAALAEVDAGAAALRFRGVAQPAPQLLGQAIAELVEADVAERFAVHLAPAIAGDGLGAGAAQAGGRHRLG
jgi:hypothetical protein